MLRVTMVNMTDTTNVANIAGLININSSSKNAQGRRKTGPFVVSKPVQIPEEQQEAYINFKALLADKAEEQLNMYLQGHYTKVSKQLLIRGASFGSVIVLALLFVLFGLSINTFIGGILLAIALWFVIWKGAGKLASSLNNFNSWNEAMEAYIESKHQLIESLIIMNDATFKESILRVENFINNAPYQIAGVRFEKHGSEIVRKKAVG